MWLNKVGTYGMSLAAYFWSRAAAALLVRLPHLLLGPDLALDILLFVDDFLNFAGTQSQAEALGFVVLSSCLWASPFGGTSSGAGSRSSG